MSLCLMSAKCHYVEYHYSECHYSKCHYADCNYAECCATVLVLFSYIWQQILMLVDAKKIFHGVLKWLGGNNRPIFCKTF